MTRPTPRQLDLLRFITGYQRAFGGVSPSIREMAAGLGIRSCGSTARLLDAAEERHLLRRTASRARAIEVLVDLDVPTALDGAPMFFIRVESLHHHEPVDTAMCCTASSGKPAHISSEVRL